MGRIWKKIGYRVQVGKQSILANRTSFARQTNTSCHLHQGCYCNDVLLNYQKGILNCWREYFCELLNLLTVQHLETSEEQIGEEIHLTEAAIKSLKTGKAFGEDDIRPKMLKVMNNFGFL